MTPEDSKTLKEYLSGAAAILFKNTPKEELQDFTSLELAVRGHILNEVAPEIGNFFNWQHRNDNRTHSDYQDQLGGMGNY
jgi:hypothetical protein